MTAKTLILCCVAVVLYAQGVKQGDVSLVRSGMGQFTVTNHSQRDVIAVQVIFTKGENVLTVPMMNYHERRDPVLRPGEASSFDLVSLGHADLVDAQAHLSYAFRGGEVIGATTTKDPRTNLKAVLDGRWKAEREIVHTFHALATTQPDQARKHLESEEWRINPDPNYVQGAFEFTRELRMILDRRGLQAAIDCAAERIADGGGK